MRSSLLILLLLSFSFSVRSQTCTGPGSTAGTAYPVCGPLPFHQDFLPTCSGPNLPNQSAGCADNVTSDNSNWYKFHCFTAGTLGFLITPLVGGTDYDWEVLDITGHDLADVYTQDLRLSLNLSGIAGPTGCTPAGLLDVRCAGGVNGSQYNRMPTLIVGHDYLLMVTNYDATGVGYDMAFSGTAGLVDPGAIPVVRNVAVANCAGTQIRVTFSEDMLCNTITSTGSEFTITNGTNVISGIASQCSVLGAISATELIINLAAPLSPGAHNLVIADGSDGNTFKNICQNSVVPISIPFIAPSQAPQAITGITFSGCAPNILDVTFAKPILCASITSTGSEFSITPGTPAITGAATICTGTPAYTNVVRLTLQNPLPHGNYQLVINNGADGNTIIDTCGIGLATGYNFPLVIPQNTVAPIIQSVVFDECHPDKLVLNFNKVFNCASVSANSSEFSITPGTHVISAAATNCGSNSYGSQITLTLQNPLPAGNFNVVLWNGADGNSISDTCYAFIAAAYSKAFVATQAPLPVISNVTFTSCAPKVLTVKLSKQILCNTITASGSEFSITPGNPAIASVQFVCTPGGYTDLINITLANQLPHGNYQVVVNNGSDGGTLTDTCSAVIPVGYTFPVVIPQTTAAPIIQSVVFDECHPDKLVLNFDKVFNCSTISASGSEFSITPGTHVISAAATNCGADIYGSQVTLTLQNPLPAGNFNVVVGNGSDGNTIADTCFAFMASAYTKAFVTTQAPLPVISNILFSGCAPKVFSVKLSKPILCNTITASGSEFSITPGNPAIASAQFVCTPGGYVDVINVTLVNQLPYGNYQLVVNNGSDGGTLTDTCNAVMQAGYTFPLVIPQTTVAPVIQSVVFDECKPFQVKVNFDKPVRCGSLSADGSEFTVTPGGFTVLAATAQCTNGYTFQATLTLSGNLPAGNFSVNIKNGADGNSLSDTCFSFMPVNATRAFTTTQAPKPIFDSVQYDKCTPSQIKVFYNHPIFCNTVAASGAQWFITGPTPVSIVSATGNCSTGSSNSFTLSLSAPINNFGTYVLHNATAGPLTLTDTCYATQSPANTISFNVLGKPSATFTDQVKFGCVMDTIVLSHPGGFGINSWQWTFSDGTNASGQNVTHTFPVSTVTATVKLIVSNGTCSDTLQRSYPLNNAFAPKFAMTPLDTVCRQKPITFTNQSTGNNLQYLWQFGDNTTFAGQTPPTHTYPNSNDYTINLIVSNNYGCKDTATKQVFITASPTVSFATLNTQYCAGDVIQLTGNITGNINSYAWSNGNNLTFADTNKVSFSYPDERMYTVTLTAKDRFCGDVSATASTQVYAVPVVNLGEDVTLCPGLTIEIGIQSRSGYTYLWNTGATASRIITQPVSNTYTLVADNHTCKDTDQVFVNVLDNCLIKVAGAFTPNNDGLNDQLKAINADLATNFLLRVYNRFGQLVFSTANPRQGWDGRQKGQPAEAGTYVWQLSYIDPISHKQVYQKGTSIMIR